MRIDTKRVGENGVYVHTKLSPVLVRKIAAIAKKNNVTKAATINELLRRALK